MHILTAFLSQETVTAAVKEHGDLLPLPLDMSAEDEAWDEKAENYLALAKEAETGREEANIRAWVQALVMVLNSLYEAPQSLAEGSKSNCFTKLNARGSHAVETEALRLLRRKIELFIAALKKEGCPSGDWRKLLRGKKLGYGGEVVGKAQRLTLGQVAPGLPPEGLGASVKALDLATGRAREILENPELIMKPLEEWPEVTAQATIMADEPEAIDLAVDMWRRKIFRIAEKHERVYGCDGRLVAAGLFGVGKGKEIMLKGICAEILRLIINLVPSNELQKDYDGDTKTLPYLGNWESILLEKGLYFFWKPFTFLSCRKLGAATSSSTCRCLVGA